MLDALRSEVIKQTTLRSTAVYFVLLIGSLFGPVVLIGLIDSENYSAGPSPWGSLLDGFFIFTAIAVSFSASRTTSDIKNHMTAQAFVTQTGRWQSLAATFVVLIGFVLLALAVGCALIVASVALFGGSVDFGESNRLWGALLLALTMSAVGIGLGALSRSTICAVALPLMWLFVGEQLVMAASSKFEVFEPFVKILLTESYKNIGIAESVGPALAVFAGWIAVFGIAAFVTNQLRDVT